jgi:hypothetical protein
MVVVDCRSNDYLAAFEICQEDRLRNLHLDLMRGRQCRAPPSLLETNFQVPCDCSLGDLKQIFITAANNQRRRIVFVTKEAFCTDYSVYPEYDRTINAKKEIAFQGKEILSEWSRITAGGSGRQGSPFKLTTLCRASEDCGIWWNVSSERAVFRPSLMNFEASLTVEFDNVRSYLCSMG